MKKERTDEGTESLYITGWSGWNATKAIAVRLSEKAPHADLSYPISGSPGGIQEEHYLLQNGVVHRAIITMRWRKSSRSFLATQANEYLVDDHWEPYGDTDAPLTSKKQTARKAKPSN